MIKKLLISMITVAFFGSGYAQVSPWKSISSERTVGLETIKTGPYSENQQFFQLNESALKQSLLNVADRLSGTKGVPVLIPNMEGNVEQFLVWENSNFAPELQAQYPLIRSYSGIGVTDKTASLNFSFSPDGVQTMVLRADKGSEFIEAYSKDRSIYVLFDSKTRTKGSLPFVCSTEDVAINQSILNQTGARSNNQLFKTMRLALSCTGEYGVYFGGTVAGALAGMNASMTRVNGVMEKDLALHLNIIANNNLVVYTDPSSDPYSPASSIGNWNGELQSTLTAVIGEANYDIGHLFGATGGGGNAGCIGCVCNPGKGSAYTSPGDGVPAGDNFDIDYVAHEMGHQLGANHTFSHSSENSQVNVEPGSGSTIMAYAGITGATDVQAHSDDYFTYRSILQIQTNLATKTCPVSVSTVNTPPAVSAGPDYTIPNGTAFVLKGASTDAEGDIVSYCWEQNDDATTVGAAASYPAGTKTNGPNFRSFLPNSSPDRYMPAYSTVLGGSLSSPWETVSTVARTLNFSLTGRDNNVTGPQTNTDEMVVNVNGTAGPFKITSPAEYASWTQGTTQTVTWDVAGTTANGVNTSNVNILFSSDGGMTFTTVLASNVANNGSAVITVPNVTSPYCRIKIEPVGNIYYAISKSIAIGYTVVTTTTCNTYTATPNAILSGATSTGFVGYSLTVPDDVIISDMDVNVNITHARVNDLRIGIAKPGSSSVDRFLYDRSCPSFGTPANMITTFDDAGVVIACSGINGNNIYKPIASLDVFNGLSSAGIWRLAVADAVATTNGVLNSFAFTFCSTNTVVTLGTQNFGFEDFVVYPNPSNGNFNVQFHSASPNGVTVLVHDMRGRKIYQNAYSGGAAFNENVQLNNAQSGIYLLTVTDGERKEVKRIVVE